MNFRYFTIGELTSSTTARRHNIKNVPGVVELNNLISLVENLLDPLRELLGKPIYVSSGYRSKKLNDIVKGSKTSQHMSGQAADVYLKGKSNIQIVKTLIRSNLEWDQCIIERGSLENPQWIHLSFRQGNNRSQILYFDENKYKNINATQINRL